jgi:ubiquinone/menaquinone biosynthesis C-methylase UbiE
MNNEEAYNQWSVQYDSNENKTRDLEAKALRTVLQNLPNDLLILELGCGTGKNTVWLADKAKEMLALDFSTEMMALAKEKLLNKTVSFLQQDLTKEWQVQTAHFDLLTCSLVLEHIENLDFIFMQAQKALKHGGQFYVGEFHPFKQYMGSKARFETIQGIFELDCFVHHVSAFLNAAKQNGFTCKELQEWFDETTESIAAPRILTMLFSKNK